MKIIFEFLKRLITLFFIKTKGQKRNFLAFGIINILITNLFLQLLLTLEIFPTAVSTLLSQIVNMLIGYYLYSIQIFKIKQIFVPLLLFKFAFLMIILWSINSIGIIYFVEIGVSKNIAALLLIAPLASISFLFQRFWVFKNSKKE